MADGFYMEMEQERQRAVLEQQALQHQNNLELAAHHTRLEGELNQTRLTQAEAQRLGQLQRQQSALQGMTNLSEAEKADLNTQLVTHIDPLVARQHRENILTQTVQRGAMERENAHQAELRNAALQWQANGAINGIRVVPHPITGVPAAMQLDPRTGVMVPANFGDQASNQLAELRLTHMSNALTQVRKEMHDEEAAANHPATGSPAMRRAWMETGAGAAQLRDRELQNRLNMHRQIINQALGVPGVAPGQPAPGPQGAGQPVPQQQPRVQGDAGPVFQVQEVAAQLPANHPGRAGLAALEAALTDGNQQAAAAALLALPPDLQQRFGAPAPAAAPAQGNSRAAMLEMINGERAIAANVSTPSTFMGGPTVGGSSPLHAIHEALSSRRQAEMRTAAANVPILTELHSILRNETLTLAQRERARLLASQLRNHDQLSNRNHPLRQTLMDYLVR